MKRIEEFVKHGKRYIYFDLSYFRTNDEFRMLVDMAKTVIEKYKKMTVYTITNVEGIRFDTETKEIVIDWMAFNTPYVKYGAIIGMDGIKKIMLNSIMATSERYNIVIAPTKEQAVETLKQREWEKWEKWARRIK